MPLILRASVVSCGRDGSWFCQGFVDKLDFYGWQALRRPGSDEVSPQVRLQVQQAGRGRERLEEAARAHARAVRRFARGLEFGNH